MSTTMFETSELGFVSNHFLDYSCTCDTTTDSSEGGTGSDDCRCEDD